MSFISLLVYIPLQILFIPIAIFGAVLVGYKQLLVSKKLGISQTAIEIINGRWTMHVFGMRDDPASAKLAAALPNTSLFGLGLCLFPLWVKSKIAGKPSMYPRKDELGEETLADLVIARTLYFDRVIERVIPQMEQFVLMGAGYDTRAYGDFQREGVAFFEIDQASVQQHKKAALQSASIHCEHVKFVSVDFDKEGVFEKLIESGFDLSKKTLFLWEGVTLYLTGKDVCRTIQDIRRRAAPGSVLLADIYADRFMKMARSGAGKKALDYTDEGLNFGLNFATNHEEVLSSFVKNESMSVGETYFLAHKNKKGPYAVVVEMKCD